MDWKEEMGLQELKWPYYPDFSETFCTLLQWIPNENSVLYIRQPYSQAVYAMRSQYM